MITRDTLGWLYILCFEAPIGNPANSRAMASHYLGYTVDLARRLAEHRAGRGQPLTAAAVARGLAWQVFYRAGTISLERHLKAHYKRTPLLCPRCAAARHRKPAYDFQPLDQLALPLTCPVAEVEPWTDGFEFPDPLPLKKGWAEIMSERRSRSVGASLLGLDATDVDIPF